MEFEILQMMKQAAGTKFSHRQVGKILDREGYRENPHWARPILEFMLCQRLIWKEEMSYFYPTDEQRDELRRKEARSAAGAVKQS